MGGGGGSTGRRKGQKIKKGDRRLMSWNPSTSFHSSVFTSPSSSFFLLLKGQKPSPPPYSIPPLHFSPSITLPNCDAIACLFPFSSPSIMPSFGILLALFAFAMAAPSSSSAGRGRRKGTKGTLASSPISLKQKRDGHDLHALCAGEINAKSVGRW